jgi:hypothetical protein
LWPLDLDLTDEKEWRGRAHCELGFRRVHRRCGQVGDSGEVLAVPVDGGDLYKVPRSTVDSGAWSLSWIDPWNNDEERPEKLQARGGVS